MWTAGEINKMSNGCRNFALEDIFEDIFEILDCEPWHKFTNYNFEERIKDNLYTMDDVRDAVQDLRNNGFDVKWNTPHILIRW